MQKFSNNQPAGGPTRVVFDFGDKIRISPLIWPNNHVKFQPGDLSQFCPAGTGVYGYQYSVLGNPLTAAPPHEPAGGIVYFGNRISKEDFLALMRILNVPAYERNPPKDYAAFAVESSQPSKDGYLAQIRIVSKFGLRYMFEAITNDEYNNFVDQELSVVEVLWAFIEFEKKRWGTSFRDNNGLDGLFGGDGDYAREELSFGFMVENDYHHVYRIWSRAWLVTK